jgi:hypothetical protein
MLPKMLPNFLLHAFTKLAVHVGRGEPHTSLIEVQRLSVAL